MSLMGPCAECVCSSAWGHPWAVSFCVNRHKEIHKFTHMSHLSNTAFYLFCFLTVIVLFLLNYCLNFINLLYKEMGFIVTFPYVYSHCAFFPALFPVSSPHPVGLSCSSSSFPFLPRDSSLFFFYDAYIPSQYCFFFKIFH